MNRGTGTIRTLIIDDEKAARRGIRALLESERDITILAECQDGLEAVEQIRSRRPDLVLLDIQMPELNGFEVLQELKGTGLPVVIFITAFDEFAMKAFRVHALDYLLKPIKPDLFRLALDRARAVLTYSDVGKYDRKLAGLIEDLSARRKYVSRFLVRSAGKLHFVAVKEINWIEAYGDYIRIHAGAARHLIRKSLRDTEAELDPEEFVRIHRSAIVRIERIAMLRPSTGGDYDLVLSDGTALTLSRTYRDHFFSRVQLPS